MSFHDDDAVDDMADEAMMEYMDRDIEDADGNFWSTTHRQTHPFELDDPDSMEFEDDYHDLDGDDL